MEFGKLQQAIRDWLPRFREACPTLGILVIGPTGVGKSTLINNLLGEVVAKEGHSLTSSTSTINCYKGEIEKVPIAIYDTPGLGDSRGTARDDACLKKMKQLIDKKVIHISIYCFNMCETRLHQGLLETFRRFNEVGINWEKTVFAATHADVVEHTAPSKVKKEVGFSPGKFFEGKLQEWKKMLPQALAKELGVAEAKLPKIEINPTTDDPEGKLPNGAEWYIPLWLLMIEVLPPYAMVRFLDIHAAHIKYGDRSTRKTPVVPAGLNIPPAPPLCNPSSLSDKNLKPPSAPVPTENKKTLNGPILLSGENCDRFERTVGEKIEEGISGWDIVKGVGGIALAGAALTVAAPLLTVSAAVALPVAAIGAVVGKIFDWF